MSAIHIETHKCPACGADVTLRWYIEDRNDDPEISCSDPDCEAELEYTVKNGLQIRECEVKHCPGCSRSLRLLLLFAEADPVSAWDGVCPCGNYAWSGARDHWDALHLATKGSAFEKLLMTLSKMPIITLKGGTRIGNFSSKHSFRFDDGSELPGCENDRVEGLMLRQEEPESPSCLGEGLFDVELTFHMNESVRFTIEAAQANQNVDVILVSFPVSKAMKASGMRRGKCRGVRMVNRVEKIASSTRFCI